MQLLRQLDMPSLPLIYRAWSFVKTHSCMRTIFMAHTWMHVEYGGSWTICFIYFFENMLNKAFSSLDSPLSSLRMWKKRHWTTIALLPHVLSYIFKSPCITTRPCKLDHHIPPWWPYSPLCLNTQRWPGPKNYITNESFSSLITPPIPDCPKLHCQFPSIY